MINFSVFQKQVIKFTIIGVGAVLVDLVFYYILLNILPEHIFSFINNEDFSKTLSFISGLAVSYNLNKFWTWRQTDRSNKRLIKFIFLYSISLVFNVLVNSFLLDFLEKHSLSFFTDHRYLFAFIGATGVSAFVNFTGQKLYVFKDGNPA